MDQVLVRTLDITALTCNVKRTLFDRIIYYDVTLSVSVECAPSGSLVGAYFIGRQLPYFGPEVYYDVLTSAGTCVDWIGGMKSNLDRVYRNIGRDVVCVHTYRVCIYMCT